MGYLLPVAHYQYQDYQNRLTENKRLPHLVEKPFKVVLERRHQEIVKEYERLEPGSYKSGFIQRREQADTTRVFAELTGTGTKVNETV
ncbi:hypothetical protein [Virgibacillus sediminis]|uniref:Uncharacterized protein n=1 Tax=Virgibacillus sediminis TaxID=202260 RepID=A0ABV7AAM2_9BACI